jgi:hypothetical protein
MDDGGRGKVFGYIVGMWITVTGLNAKANAELCRTIKDCRQKGYSKNRKEENVVIYINMYNNLFKLGWCLRTESPGLTQPTSSGGLRRCFSPSIKRLPAGGELSCGCEPTYSWHWRAGGSPVCEP